MDSARQESLRPIRFLTFNLRFDTELDAPAGNRWTDRRLSVFGTLEREEPDIIGFQEALKSQLADLSANLAGYRGLGKPREIGETAEYVPLFFKVDRFELQEHGDFWLSPTPNVEGSRGWDTDAPRHCTWARLRDKQRGGLLAAFNTHLDNKGETARREATKLIVTEISMTSGLPTVIMGDFNAPEDSEPLETFKEAGFRDAFRVANPDVDNAQTFHLFGQLSSNIRLDYIMCDSAWDVVSATIVRTPAGGRLPSDHFPVAAELVLRPRQDPAPG